METDQYKNRAGYVYDLLKHIEEDKRLEIHHKISENSIKSYQKRAKTVQ